MERAASGPFRAFGLDLAWADHNPSGVCVLDGTGLVVDEQSLTSDDEIIEWIEDHLGGPAVVAADIPLQVPNPEGTRRCDRHVASDYGARKAGPHPANRSLFLARHGRVRGEELATRLGALGFDHPWAGGDRTLLEVYPHPGLVDVFGLPERHLYKKGTLAQRRLGLRRLRRLLAGLEEAHPALLGPPITISTTAGGRELKSIEDRLDARFCAWTAALWHVRPGAVRLYGDPAGGHIAVPFSRSGPT